jgi:flagellar L-ring protein FlgH
MKVSQVWPVIVVGALSAAFATSAHAEDLYRRSPWAAVAHDQVAQEVGDILTVIVFQSAEARNSAENEARKTSSFGGRIEAGSTDEGGEVSLGSDYSGRGEIRRSESFVTRFSVTVTQVMANGDLVIEGDQLLFVNGEKTIIRVRGRIRPADINADNQVVSTEIADAEISYSGEGFVSRGSQPGWLHRVFSRLGLGG